MRKTFTLLKSYALLVVLSGMFISTAKAQTPSCTDTLNLPFAGTPTIYVTSNASGVKNGYVSGNGAAGHKAKAEKFVNTSTTINGAIIGFGRARFASTASTVNIAIWNATGANGTPGATPIASKTVPINTIAANIAAGLPTTVTFTTPVAVTGNFYIGMVLPTAAGDTVAFITSTHTTTGPVGKGWQQLSNNTWAPYSDAAPAGWGLNISNAIFPIVTGTTPVPSFTQSVTSVCAGNTVTFSSSPTIAANTYSWSFPGGTPATSTSPNPTVTYSTPGTYNVSLTANNTGCNLTATLNQTNAITVNAVPTPQPVASYTQSATTVCRGSSVTFNAAASTGATSYSWFFQNGTPSTSTSPNPTVTYNGNPGSPLNVSLTVTSGTGPCAPTATQSSTVTIAPLPTVAVTPASASICANPVSLTASGANTYSWTPATGLSATTGATVTANPSVTTVYTVTGTTSAGCIDTQTVRVIVPNITADFTPSGKVFDLKNGAATVTFTNTSVNANSFKWNFGEPGLSTNNISLLQNPNPVTYPYKGTFIVTLEAMANGCTEIHKDTIVVRNTTGLNDAFENGRIRIFPNPAKNYLQIDVPENENVTSIQLTNSIGQVIAKQKPTAGSTRLNVANLPAGIYFVRITNAEGSIIKKISIEQ